MIIGLGLDVTTVRRMDQHCDNMQFMKRILHPRELEGILHSSESRAELLASRFAVKEAFGKALGTGMRGLSFSDIELDHDNLGKPFLHLHGTAEKLLKSIGADSVLVSLSHEKDTAAAVVILEKY
jgi:holo-[acyl-carrier protein] synthase